MALKKNITIQDLIQIFLRKKWVILFSFLLTMFGASVYCVVAKELYVSTSSILVIPQEIPSSLVQSTASYDLAKRLGALQNQLTSKTYLSALIEKFDLFPGQYSDTPGHKLIKAMRSKVWISASKRSNVFNINFAHRDPYTAMKVASHLTTIFLDANVKMRTRSVSGTREFFESELQQVEEQLEVKDEQIKKFRIRYFGELPEQLDTNIEAKEKMEERLESISDAKREIEEKITIIDRDLAKERAKAEKLNVDLKTVDEIIKGADLTLSENAKLLLRQIAEKKKEIASLRLQYTDNHPIIKQALLVIETLRDKLRGERVIDETSRIAYEKYYGITPEAKGVIDMMAVLNGQKKSLEKEIRNLLLEKSEANKKISDYQTRIENTPRRELEVKELTRDYDTLRDHYKNLLEKKMNVELSESLEIKQKGEQFQLLDPAEFPDRPITPDRPKIMLYGLFISFLLGFGGALGLEFIDDTVKNPSEFREFFDIPILVSLPLLMTKKEKRKIMMRKMLIVGGLILYVIALSTFILSYKEKIVSLLSMVKLGL